MGGKGVLGCTGSSRKPGSSQIFRHPGASGRIRTTARTWITAAAMTGAGLMVPPCAHNLSPDCVPCPDTGSQSRSGGAGHGGPCRTMLLNVVA